jgi:hypothetical protein
MRNQEELFKTQIKEAVLSEKSRSSADPEHMTKQIEELKELVKEQTKSLRESGGMLPHRPEFPTRFCTKPFVHYGNTVKVATIKKKEIDNVIKANDNRMKIYVALLQKEKNAEKPTLKSMGKELLSPRTRELAEVKHPKEHDQDFGKFTTNQYIFTSFLVRKVKPLQMINIDTIEEILPKNRVKYEDTVDIDDYDRRVIVTSPYDSNGPDALPLIVSKNLSPIKHGNESTMLHQSTIPEISQFNKTVLEKNSEHVPKQKIIASIRKFDDRCK